MLAKNGIPIAVSQTWSPARRLAALVVIGESEGGQFDWDALKMNWPKP